MQNFVHTAQSKQRRNMDITIIFKILLNYYPKLWCRGYKVRYKSAEEGAKPEETYVPSTEDTEQCSLVLEVSPERNQPQEKKI